MDLLKCRCKGTPNCDCPPRKLSEIIIRLRTSGFPPEEITGQILNRYGIEAYPGDLLEYLNDAVRICEAVARLSDVLKKPKLGDRSRDLSTRIIG
jgi:helicase